MAGHPNMIVMLTADAFGVLPPISKMSAAQAMYHFLSGYTAKVAGTERGVTEPTATFSTCFAAPFLVHHPTVYAKLLGERIAKHDVQCWLVNTGWTGGSPPAAKRMKIAYTRAMVNAAIEGRLRDVRRKENRSSASRSRNRYRACPTTCSIPAKPGAIRRRTTRKQRNSPDSSPRTSSNTKRPPRPTCSPL